jgi:hypothetical protein
MSNTRSEKESIGLRVVGQFVREIWKCRFQELDARNDDGIDGIIFLSKSGEATGETIFVQVKCGATYKVTSPKDPDKFKLKLGIDYIETHRPRWNRYPGPVILIYIDDSTDKILPKGWWADLKSQFSYDLYHKSYIIVNNLHRFGEHSKGYFKNLCNHHLDYGLKAIQLSYDNFKYLDLSKPLKQSAREKYKSIGNKVNNKLLGDIVVNRVGWKHITRKDRKVSHIHQSFELLGALPSILYKSQSFTFIKNIESYEKKSNRIIVDLIAFQAKVTFPHRFQSVVVVVLKRKRRINENGKANTARIWFYSIFESRRGKEVF